MWQTMIFDTRTGEPLLPVEAAAANGTRRISGTGSGSHSFVVRGTGLPRETWRDLLRPNARTVAHVWGGHVAYAGFIEARPSYSRKTGIVTVAHKEIREYLRARAMFRVDNYAGGGLSVIGRTYQGAVRAILQRAMGWGAEWQFPFDLPADGVGGFTATWENHQVLTVDDALKQVEDAGCEIDFEPYLDANGWLRWRVRVADPVVNAAVTTMPVTVEKSVVKDLEVGDDASRQVTGMFVSANGTEADMVTGSAGTIASPSIPVRDGFLAAKDIATASRANALAERELAANVDPVEQWSFGVQLGDPMTPDLVAPGSLVSLDIRGDDWMPDDLYMQRVIALAWDMTTTVTPEVQAYG